MVDMDSVPRGVDVPAITSGQAVISGAAAVRTLIRLTGPSIAAGVIARRKSMMPLLERRQSDRGTIDAFVALRDQFGPGPLTLQLPGRTIVVPLHAEDAAEILASSPSPFTPANREKRAALAPFQPHGVLISTGPVRGARREFNEQVLDTPYQLHHLAGAMAPAIRAEASDLVARAGENDGVLDSELFLTTWWRLVRRLVLGEGALSDDAVTDMLWALRSRGNWSYLLPKNHRLRAQFERRLFDYVENADPLSLAGAVAASRTQAAVDPVGQIPHWLFAFDAAGMGTLRALAVLAAQQDKAASARREIDGVDLSQPQVLSYLQACLLDSVRLWPTTPVLLRDADGDATWTSASGRHRVESGSALLILATAFHRDSETIDFADDFAPEAWLDGRAAAQPALVPFSAGPARCPGENLVLFVTSMFMANVLHMASSPSLVSTPSLAADKPLPATLDHYSVRISLR